MSLAHGREFFYKKKLIRGQKQLKMTWVFLLPLDLRRHVECGVTNTLVTFWAFVVSLRSPSNVAHRVCMDGKTSKIYEFYWVEISTLHDLASLDWVMYHPPLLNFQPRKMFQLSKFKDPHTRNFKIKYNHWFWIIIFKCLYFFLLVRYICTVH